VPQGSGVMWVFALPDTLPSTAPGSAQAAPVRPATAAAATPAARTAPVATRAASTGVFTEAQARRGEQLFNQACSKCHNVTDHTGTSFTAKWSSNSLGDIFDQVSTMPPASPGGLNPDGYANLVAFFLSKSGYTPGREELPADRNALKGIRVGTP
jgi:mono/diheme cytochrome c family protein